MSGMWKITLIRLSPFIIIVGNKKESAKYMIQFGDLSYQLSIATSRDFGHIT